MQCNCKGRRCTKQKLFLVFLSLYIAFFLCILKRFQRRNVPTTSSLVPTTSSLVGQTEPSVATPRKIVLCFPYNGEKIAVTARISRQPEALIVVSESFYGHNGFAKNGLLWPMHFPNHTSEYVTLHEKVYDASSADGRWAQETTTRRILGNGVRNLYTRGEITDNDIVVVTDADEIVSSSALSWLQTYLQHDTLARVDFQWFLFTHCYQHRNMIRLPVAVTVQTLRLRLKWDTHKVRSSPRDLLTVHIAVDEASSHCSWCISNAAIREKMRLNIEGSSWESRGASYVFSDAELNHMRFSGLWFDGNVHGICQCTPQQITTEMALYDASF